MYCKSLKETFDILDLDYKGLEEVKNAVRKEEYDKGLTLLKSYFENRNNVNLYIKEDEPEAIADYCKENWMENVKETIKVAEEVRNKEFLFKFRWDMERSNVPVAFKDEILWDKIPFDDEEWVFMLNRHKYWTALGQAFALTQKKEYEESFYWQLEHWIDNNQDIEANQKTTWRTIEAGIRCENWIKSYQFFKKSCNMSPELLAKLIICLYNHGKYIYSKYDNFRKLSNWGVLENHGLFILSVFLPELKISKTWRDDSINRLQEEINLQVMGDGVHWEQSPMYHNEVLHCYLDTINLAKKNNIDLPEDILSKTKDLAYADLYMAKPNHNQPMQSDSDDTDLRDIITMSSVIFNDENLKFGGYDKIDFHSIWDLGIEALDIYEGIEGKEPQYKSYGFKDSGNYYMRSSWREDANYIYFHCGHLGSGHGHADLLHFDLFAYGEDLLIDSGRYTYVEGNPLREYFKSCRAHNTTIVDNSEFTKCSGSWSYSKAAVPIKGDFINNEIFDFVEGAHMGYMDSEDPVYPCRKIIFVKPHYWVLIDSFYGKGEHKFEQLFHFPQGNVVEQDEKRVYFQGKKVGLNIIPFTKKLQCKISEAYISKEYNSIEKSKMLSYSIKSQGFTSLITVLYPEKMNNKLNIKCEKLNLFRGKGEVVEQGEAEAIKIKINEKEEHILLVTHNEIHKGSKLYIVDDIPVYGKIALIKKKDDENKVSIIKY